MKNYKGKWLEKPSTQQEWIFAHLGKMIAKRTAKNLSLKGKKALKEERMKVSSPRTPRNGRSASGF